MDIQTRAAVKQARAWAERLESQAYCKESESGMAQSRLAATSLREKARILRNLIKAVTAEEKVVDLDAIRRAGL